MPYKNQESTFAWNVDHANPVSSMKSTSGSKKDGTSAANLQLYKKRWNNTPRITEINGKITKRTSVTSFNKFFAPISDDMFQNERNDFP